MHNILLIIAKSGVGKDTLVQEFIKKYPKYSQILSYTTRKPRYVNESTHVFIDKSEVDNYRNEIVAYTLYNNSEYFATLTQLYENDFYVIDPRGVYFLQDYIKENNIKDLNIVTINIKASWFRRFIRMRKRGDSFINTIKRLWNDRKDFKGFEGKYTITNNNFATALEDLRKTILIEEVFGGV